MGGQEAEQHFGRDGISGLVSPARALRARDVSRPSAEELAEAARVAAELVRRRRGGVTRR